jgi:hypothetical protein
VSVQRRSRFPLRPLLAGAMLAALGLSLPACSEIETETAAGYEPATVESVKGRDDLKRVTLTAEGARRIALKTEEVGRSEGHKAVPYAALIYDPEGDTYVYTSSAPLSFLRQEVEVQRVDGNRALLSKGPPAGTTVVTVGAAEVYGAELEIASK